MYVVVKYTLLYIALVFILDISVLLLILFNRYLTDCLKKSTLLEVPSNSVHCTGVLDTKEFALNINNNDACHKANNRRRGSSINHVMKVITTLAKSLRRSRSYDREDAHTYVCNVKATFFGSFY